MIRIALLDKPYMFRPVEYTEKFPADVYFRTEQEMWDWIKLNLMHNNFEKIIGFRVMYDRLEEYSAEDGWGIWAPVSLCPFVRGQGKRFYVGFIRKVAAEKLDF